MVDNEQKPDNNSPQPKSQVEVIGVDETNKIANQDQTDKDQIANAITTTAQNIDKERLGRVDEYINTVERPNEVQSAQQSNPDIDVAEDTAKKDRALSEAIKNNLSGFDLEKEL